MTYAERTKVPIGQSKAEIEKLVKKYSAGNFMTGDIDGRANVVFQMCDRNIRFTVAIPENEQAARSMWRALLLTIKAKLESAERGIETFEQAFLANIVMQDGRTVADHAIPRIESHYAGDQSIPLLPAPN